MMTAGSTDQDGDAVAAQASADGSTRLASGVVEVRVGPERITIHADDQYVVTRPDARIRRDRQEGYFVADTRLVSRFEVALSDTPPTLLNSSAIQPFSCRFEFVNEPLTTESGHVEEGTIHLRLDRTIGGGVHDDYDLSNYSGQPVALDLQIRIEGDFADLFDVKQSHLVRRGATESTWDAGAKRLSMQYVNAGFRRGLRLEVDRNDSIPLYSGGMISFPVRMDPGGHWHGCLLWTPLMGGAESGQPIEGCHQLLEGDAARMHQRHEWERRVTKMSTGDPSIDKVVHRAVHDLAAMRIHRHDGAARGADSDEIDDWVPAAGVPWFVTLFGRDTLIVSLQAMALSPRIGRATLRALAAMQGDSYDDSRDEQPGKIEHELRHGELASLGKIPQTPYYGTHDATALFVWAAGELWRWTGDRQAMKELRPHVERALSWIDTDGDPDGDGLQEYRTRAGDWGYYNQGWKDAGGAIVGADGSLSPLPLALCELQGYVVAAKRAWATVAEEGFGDLAGATRLRDEAHRLAEALERRFWWEEEGTYYLGLDGHKRPIESVASNPGHLLWAGAVVSERAAKVVNRLTAVDMWSGWGVRTLSDRHRSYNPFSYQLGSIWPHDNAIVANGFRRYGHDEAAWQVAEGLFAAASRFHSNRLPEVFAGLQRDPGGFPAQYLGANVPQAWASGAVVHLISMLVGAEPDAFRGRITVDPALPPWMPELRISDLRLGRGLVDLVISSEGVESESTGGVDVDVAPATRGGGREVG